MQRIIRFNEKNIYFERKPENNWQFLRRTSVYLKEKLRLRGYIYLNDIYEAFGAEWKPEWENECIVSTNGSTTFDIGIRERNCCDFEITITF